MYYCRNYYFYSFDNSYINFVLNLLSNDYESEKQKFVQETEKNEQVCVGYSALDTSLVLCLFLLQMWISNLVVGAVHRMLGLFS